MTRWQNAPKTRSARRTGPIEHVPDLAVEITSPDDRPGRIADKLAFYLRAGVPLVWMVDPEDRTVSVYRPGEPVRMLGVEDTLTAVPLFPSFSTNLSDLFGILDRNLED